MKQHVKIYLDYFDYSPADFIPCEVCSNKAVDIHHIDSRGMGGDPKGTKDCIENLQALCRKCHTDYGDIRELKDTLIKLHALFIERNKPLKRYAGKI